MASISLSPPTESPLQSFVKAQFLTKLKPPPSSTSLSGQTAIITGSNSGIGLAAVDVLLQYHVSYIILAVRSVEKGENAADPLRNKYPNARIEVWPLDMLSYESIQEFARRCDSLPRLDKVILNAGLMIPEFVINPSTAHETTFQVNYLSTALLAFLLLPILKSKRISDAPGRMTIVASALGVYSKFANRDVKPLIPSFDSPDGWSAAAALERYSVSKTLVLMLLQKLCEVVDPTDVIINTVEPGFVKNSGLNQHTSRPIQLAMWVVKAITGRSPKQGAWTYADAVAVKGKESHGGLVLNWAVHP